jgi:transposase
MSCCSVLHDLKAQIPVLYYEQNFTVKEICGIFGIKKSLTYSTLKSYQLTQQTYNPCAQQSGQHCSLITIDLKFIHSFMQQRHCTYLNELQDQLYAYCGVWVSTTTLLCTLQHLHFSQKCVTTRAIEHNELLHSNFMLQIGCEVCDPAMLMFIDEAVKNEKTKARRYRWSLEGQRCIQRSVFVCGQRWSILTVPLHTT